MQSHILGQDEKIDMHGSIMYYFSLYINNFLPGHQSSKKYRISINNSHDAKNFI